MDEIEVADEENENYPQEDNDSDGDSFTSEKEVQLYNLIYHEHNETNGIEEDVENPNRTEEDSELHFSARSKVFRLNAVKAITCSPSVVNSMSPSKSVRNQIKKVTAKLDAMKQKYSKENNEKIYSRNHFNGKKQTFIKNNEKLSGSSIPSFCLNQPEADKKNEQSHDDSCHIVPNDKDCGNAVTEKISTTVCIDKVGDEREAEISKYDIILSGRSNLSTSESVIVIDSDAESVDSVIEVKPPTPPPPVVINIDSSDESSHIKQKEKSTQKENIDPHQHPDTIQIDTSSDDVALLDSSLSADSLSTTVPSENALVVSYTVPSTGNNVLDQDEPGVEQSVDTVVKAKKRKRKSENSKPRRVKPRNKVLSQSVPLSWTSDMIRFYCHSWGGHKFNHEELQKQMPGNSSNWKVLEIDFLGPLPKNGPFKRARCLNCNQLGHILQQCPDPIREICCCMCGARGHTKHTCPNKICLQCGRPATKYSKGCKKCCFATQQCTGCGQHGHYMWMCPEAWRIYHSTTSPHENSVSSKYPLKRPNEQFCCNCARRGHTSLNCKFPNSETFDTYDAQSRSLNFNVFPYKNHKNNGHHNKFSVPNMNRKLKKNKTNNNVTIVTDSESFNHRRKKLTNTERKRIKKKQKKVLQNKMANT
ncbi:uncharacterized protein LOC126248884 [Schistocerca nitens]|uniref:uncharacterized protein LOC126248884 n=1 Tax=Schistocerca nitens TaxID=7011 RepID=UPI002118F3B9|nr:uncharacterized protein LOC126248884 [Schistocerca nitens]XP_049806312.1 uncharacterized protein LOC126248884 [Schistocerca nitens]